MTASGDETKAMFRSLARELRAIRVSLERIEEIVEGAAGENESEERGTAAFRRDEPGLSAIQPAAADAASRPGFQDFDGASAGRVVFDSRFRGNDEEPEEPLTRPPNGVSTSAPAPASADLLAMLGLDPAAGTVVASPIEPKAARAPFDPFADLASSGADTARTDLGSLDLPDPFAEIAATSPATASEAKPASAGSETGVPSDDELLELLGSVNSGAGAPQRSETSHGPPPRPQAQAAAAAVAAPPGADLLVGGGTASNPGAASSMAAAAASMASADSALAKASTAAAAKFDMSPEDLESIFGWKS